MLATKSALESGGITHFCLQRRTVIVETRAPIPAKPGRKARHDYEYERNGVANLFMVFAPLEGLRHVKVTDRHTAIDYAHTLLSGNFADGIEYCIDITEEI